MKVLMTVLKTLFASLYLIAALFETAPAGGDFPPSGTAEPGDETKYLQIAADDEGFDVFRPVKNMGGYRYGPSMILNADGSLDAWYAANGPGDIVDVVTYKRLYDGGKKSTREVIALKPSAESYDQMWTCDPGVIKFGDYYYIGYTTTVNPDGVDNDVCVARSRDPQGPFEEKWDGEGWSASPKPIVRYTDDPQRFGAGEPAFVVMGDTLFIYYSWSDNNGAATRVATADATDENWPATIVHHGECIPAKSGGDSADVKYADAYGRFVAVFTEKRFSEDSYVAVWDSFDGLRFRKSGYIKANTAQRLHNCGISGRADGHIGENDPVYLSYAYGGAEEGSWGKWATRLHTVSLSLADEAKRDDTLEKNRSAPVSMRNAKAIPEIMTVKAEKQVYTLNGNSRHVWAIAFDSDGFVFPLFFGVTFDGYDRSVIRIVGSRIYPVGEGVTRVRIRWHGFSGDFVVHVNAKG